MGSKWAFKKGTNTKTYRNNLIIKHYFQSFQDYCFIEKTPASSDNNYTQTAEQWNYVFFI